MTSTTVKKRIQADEGASIIIGYESRRTNLKVRNDVPP